MIKNTLIAILVLGIVALSWMALSRTDDKPEVVGGLQHKVDELKRQINQAYDAAKEQPEAGFRSPAATEKQTMEGESGLKMTIVRENDPQAKLQNGETENGGKPTSGQSAANVLGGIGQGKKRKKDALTSEDVNSILSILKSAQDILGKTSFRFPQSEEGTPIENSGSQATDIKKKSSSGPEESG